jgi:retinol dehydrogenase-12
MASDLEGKVILVTGATEGIGKAAARELGLRGATLVLVARNPEKGARVVAELKAQTGNDHIQLLLADLSKQADVRAVAKAFRERHDRLDVLVNNAGAMIVRNQRSADGYEMTFALNHLSYFLLTHELLDVLKKTPGARIVCTASGAHGRGRIELDTIATRRVSPLVAYRAYGDSKLANILFTRELARRLEGTSVTVNCFHPGFVHTGFGGNNGTVVGAIVGLAATVAGRTPEKGAETLVWLATSPDAAKFNGEYFFDCAPGRRSRRARDDEMAGRLWELSERLCGLVTAGA